MADNLNISNLYKCSNTAEEFGMDVGQDTMPFCEDMKTEVKEQCRDFETSIEEVVPLNTTEEYTYSPEIHFEIENLELVKSTVQSLNENVDIGNCEKFNESCHSNFDEEIYLRCHYGRCPLIDKKLSNKNGHLLKKYKCNDCKFATNNEGGLRRHNQIHIIEKPFKCTYKNCKCKPGQAEPCNCDACEYAYMRKHDLQTHILARHSAKRNKYRCADCKFATHLKQNLTVHFRTYTKHKYKDC